ncbi:MAG: NAD-dependent epimerase/dehydratase family protein [Candidatus Woesearchaeota archaeon]|nr:NAD-dependent epimerase/dehydratase family protein [Candidatus Woesearchaeota archaeon]
MTKVLVTGGNGFFGGRLVPALQEQYDVVAPSREECDLTSETAVATLFEKEKPAIVVHLAADLGGIGYVRTHPGSVFYNNLMMNTLVLEYARRHNVQKFIGISTVNAYPGDATAPFAEEQLHDGIPDEDMIGYGLAKRLLITHSQLYHKQYGFPAVNVLLDSIYGPGDVFVDGKMRVIPANIRRFIEASGDVVAWGSGKPERDFVYVDDAVRAVLFALEHLDTPDPVNIGTGSPVTIKELVETIASLTGFTGTISWDTTKPDGQMQRYLSTKKAASLGFQTKTTLQDGLQRTIAWYKTTY